MDNRIEKIIKGLMKRKDLIEAITKGNIEINFNGQSLQIAIKVYDDLTEASPVMNNAFVKKEDKQVVV